MGRTFYSLPKIDINELNNILTQISIRLDVIQVSITEIEAEIAALEARIEALESP